MLDTEMDVPRVDAADLSYEAFCERYLAPNVPVLIKNIGADWRIYHEWRRCDDGTVNHAYLRARFGRATVPVVGYGRTDAYGDEDRCTMSLDEYLTLLESGEAHTTQRYMKDWHFTRDFPQERVYTTPSYFQDDWLNWWWDRHASQRDDYRFVYLGPASSTTPLHHDVLLSYSWSINICGKKEWILFPPTETWKLRDRSGRFTASDATHFDANEFPHLATAHGITVVQDVGEALFVPSGWYHQVKNLDRDTLSINHNWFNAYSLDQMWAFLQAELGAVEREISHCRDTFDSDDEWHHHCQVLLRANIGMNFEEVTALLRARKEWYLAPRESSSYDTSKEFSLHQIDKVLDALCAHEAQRHSSH